MSDGELADWLLKACASANKHAFASTCHGPIGHHTGPTAFAMDLGVIRECGEEQGDLLRFFLYGGKMKHTIIDRSGGAGDHPE